VSLARKQLTVVAGTVPAFVVAFFTARYAPTLFGFAALPADNTAARLAFASHWLMVPGLALLAGIVVASRRGFIADAIDGTRSPLSRSLEINLRYNQNTLEQTVLAAIAWINLSLMLPQERLVLIPAAAFLFGFGPAAFWIGYLIYPTARAFGMVLTVLPTIAGYVWLLQRALGG
jgi:hypothetical protein